MRIAIVDDLRKDREHLETELRACLASMGYDAELLEIFTGGEEFLEAFVPGRYDVICLDIYMNGITGIETAQQIRPRDRDVKLVFISTSNEFAAESYSVRADYYLLKPYQTADIQRMLRVINPDEMERNRILVLPDESKCLLHEIMYTEYTNHKVTIHFRDGHEHALWASQSDMEKLLCSRGPFMTSTKGIIVNLEQVAAVGEMEAKMQNGEMVPVSRARRAELKQAHADYLFRSLRKEGGV